MIVVSVWVEQEMVECYVCQIALGKILILVYKCGGCHCVYAKWLQGFLPNVVML